MKTPASFIAVAALSVVLQACNPGSTCGPSTCTGCCDASGTCQGGSASNACGTSGGLCLVCALGQSCNVGQCGSSSQGGGSGGGTQSTGGGGGTTDTLTVSTFCEQFFKAQFDLSVACGESTQRSADLNLALYAAPCMSVLPGVKDGRQSFSATEAQRCLDTLGGLTCLSHVTPVLTGCEKRVAQGLVTNGGDCYDSSECITGSWCNADVQCPGACEPRIAIGQPSTSSKRCIETAYLYDGVCAAYVAAGQSCAPLTGVQQEQTCASDGVCDASKLCATRPALGDVDATCASHNECGIGRRCVNNLCTALGAANGACDALHLCSAGLNCSAANECVPYGLVDATCTMTTPCEDTLFCNVPAGSTAGVCSTRRTDGQSCTESGRECERTLFCSASLSSSGSCVPLRGADGACTPGGRECGEALYCTATAAAGGVCAARKNDGATCGSNSECESLDCANQVCAAGRCVDPTP